MRIREAMSCNHFLAGALVVVAVLAWRGWAYAAPPSHHPSGGSGGASVKDPSIENRPSSSFEERLMGELACVCGTCDREPILDCDCKLAAQMRGELKSMLRAQHLSTPAGRDGAARAVRQSFVLEYGDDVLHPKPKNGADGGAAGWIALLVVGGSLVSLVVVARRIVARRPAKTG